MKVIIKIDKNENVPEIFIDGRKISGIVSVRYFYETATDSLPSRRNLSIEFADPKTKGRTVKTIGFYHD